jgi:5'(3')-deoxyribonucleotidase
MDGVLVDFDGGACKIHGVASPWLKPENLGKWGAEKEFGFSYDDFWLPMGETFWAKLKWTAEGQEILAITERVFGRENICLMTTPCQTAGCAAGKIEWIKKNMPTEYREQFMLGFQKYFCAHTDTILIDDSDKNVNAFRAHGGSAILVPRLWNTNYKHVPYMMNYFKEEMSKYVVL